MIQKLTPKQLRRTIDPATLGFETTAQLAPLEGIVGQTRAVSALKFGLGIQNGGFNIYVAGPPGIGKMTAVQSFIGHFAQQQPTPSDWCYVNNFEDSYQPTILALPAGRGRQLRDDMERLIQDARRELEQRICRHCASSCAHKKVSPRVLPHPRLATNRTRRLHPSSFAVPKSFVAITRQ